MKRNYDLTWVLVLALVVMAGMVIWQNEVSRHASEMELAACRSSNPGFDCKRGWVKAEPFAPPTGGSNG